MLKRFLFFCAVILLFFVSLWIINIVSKDFELPAQTTEVIIDWQD